MCLEKTVGAQSFTVYKIGEWAFFAQLHSKAAQILIIFPIFF